MLTAAQAELIDAERALLDRLLGAIQDWDADPEDLRRVRDARGGLDELFLVVVAGEFNAGKSRLINALLGGRYLEEGVTPTTQQVQVLTFGDPDLSATPQGPLRRRLPVPLLAEMHIVDTPGTNAILREHEALTRDFIPRADLVVFVTSADRPFTESERAFLESIRDWGKKIVFVINKFDLVEGAEDRAQIVGFVRGAATALLNLPPTLFPLSSRDALGAMEAGDADRLAASGWPAFASWLRETLTAAERIRLKIDSPLGVADKVAGDARGEIRQRLEVLAADRAALDEVDRVLALYREDMGVAWVPHFERIDAHLSDLGARGEAFIEEHFRLAKIRQLIKTDALRAAFEREVVAAAPDAIAREVDAMIDWTVDREHAQWNIVRRHLSARAASDALREVSRDDREGFAARRRAMLERVGGQTEAVIGGFNARDESARLVADVQNMLASAGLVEVGALGLGLILTAALHTLIADVTGILAAGTLAVLGLAIIPYRRRQAVQALRARLAALRKDLRRTLAGAFEREVGASIDHMRGAIEPYGRFIRAESQQLETLDAQLATIDHEITALRERARMVAGG